MKRSMYLLAAVLLLTGCVSSTKTPESYKPPPLMIAQNGDGDVTLQWKSEAGYVYTIYYQTAPDADWQGLDKAFRVPGTGGMLTAYDHVNPARRPPAYRIVQEKAK